MFVVNGTVMLGGKVFHRIDDISEGRVGLDFLNNPGALVPERELAERIVILLNGDTPKCPHECTEKVLGGYEKEA